MLKRIAIAIVLVIVLAVGIAWWKGPAASIGWIGEDSVAVVWVEGEIADSDELVTTLDEIAKAEPVKALVLRVDSPGGAVAPSQEIFDAVLRVRAAKPTIASLGNLAASGGYYVASACDAIVANPGSLTGSIGVIMQVGNVEELLRKVGLGTRTLKAGEFKDIGSPTRAMTDAEAQLIEGMLRNVHEQFIGAVARGRKLPAEQIRKIADGRIFSGEQAKELGLVDELGGLKNAIDLAAGRAKIAGEPNRVDFREGRTTWWMRLLGRAASELGVRSSGLRWELVAPIAG